MFRRIILGAALTTGFLIGAYQAQAGVDHEATVDTLDPPKFLAEVNVTLEHFRACTVTVMIAQSYGWTPPLDRDELCIAVTRGLINSDAAKVSE